MCIVYCIKPPSDPMYLFFFRFPMSVISYFDQTLRSSVKKKNRIYNGIRIFLKFDLCKKNKIRNTIEVHDNLNDIVNIIIAVIRYIEIDEGLRSGKQEIKLRFRG